MQKEPAGEKITYVLNVRSRFKLMMLSMRGSHKISHSNKACSLFAQFAKLRIKRGNMVLFLTSQPREAVMDTGWVGDLVGR